MYHDASANTRNIFHKVKISNSGFNKQNHSKNYLHTASYMFYQITSYHVTENCITQELTSRRNVSRCVQRVSWVGGSAMPPCQYWLPLMSLLSADVSVYDMRESCIWDARLHRACSPHTHWPRVISSSTFSCFWWSTDHQRRSCCHYSKRAIFSVKQLLLYNSKLIQNIKLQNKTVLTVPSATVWSHTWAHQSSVENLFLKRCLFKFGNRW